MLLTLPFIILLSMIASGPVAYPHFWEKHYRHIAGGLGIMVIVFSLLQGNVVPVIESGVDYISFICLLGSLYIVSGGIYIFSTHNATPGTNVLFLLLGALIANVVGTTGASVLLIRPFLRLNKFRMKPYLIIFFIFIVSNAGGLLTPLGDPPLFFGFLKGVPFLWNIIHLSPVWLLVNGCLLAIFYQLDRKNTQGREVQDHTNHKWIIHGRLNFLFLGIIVASLFLDPNTIEWLPYISFHGHKISVIRELIQASVAVIAWMTANKHNYQANEFSFNPILEVVFLFFGLFFTMIPAMALVRDAAADPTFASYINSDLGYWLSGVFSSFLDNAPTYINILTGAMAKYGLDIQSHHDVVLFLSSSEGAPILFAISVGSVLFGAFTYIGNGPNFMVKSIAENEGVNMPPFLTYIGKFAIPYLLPVLILVYIIFIVF